MKESDIKVIETMIGAFQKSMLNPLLQVQGIVVIDTTELRVFKCFYGRGQQKGMAPH